MVISYSKEEYETLRTRIIEHMEKTGEWGMPLPPGLSPFAYNETVAQEYFPLTKEQVLARGARWRDESQDELAVYQGPKAELPDDIKDAPVDLPDKILNCGKCGKPYKISPQELKLYKNLRIPLPRFCFNDRHLERISQRNPRKLFDRDCQQCSRALQSTFSKDRPETIYCEECYMKTIY